MSHRFGAIAASMLLFAGSPDAKADAPLVLILSSGDDARALEDGFMSELELAMDTYRIERSGQGDTSFLDKDGDELIFAAGQLAAKTGASAVIWLAFEADSVGGVGLYVASPQAQLARIVAFDSPMDYLPDLAVVVSELILHAMAYGEDEKSTEPPRAFGGTAEAPEESAKSGLGRRIEAPDGWILVSRSKAAEKPEDVGPIEDARVPTEDKPGGAESAPGDGEAAESREDRTENKPDEPAQATSPSPSDVKKEIKREKDRRLGISMHFVADQGVGGFFGPATWLGGVGSLVFRPVSPLFIRTGLSVNGGAFPRSGPEVKGARLAPELSAAYYFAVKAAGLGPELGVAACRIALSLKEQGYLLVEKDWWVFRASIGLSLRLPLNSRISFELAPLVHLYSHIKEYVRPEPDRGEVFTTPIAELSVRAGVSVLL